MSQTLHRHHVDDQLELELRAVLDRCLDVPPTVRASVLDRQVTLSGTAHWQHERVAAGRVAGEVKGVRSVVNHLVLNPTAVLPDLTTAIRAGLVQQANAEASRIDARTDAAGVIEVTGTVRCPSERSNVEQICQSFPTVTAVVSHLQIRDDEARR